MTKILAINCGSASLKFQLLAMDTETVLADGLIDKINFTDCVFNLKFQGESEMQKEKYEMPIKNHQEAVGAMLSKILEKNIITNLSEISAIGHRIVHGGEKFSESVLIDENVITEIKNCIPLAPLHNPANLMGIETFASLLPNVKQVAVFDTAFHATIPEFNFLYALPYEWYQDFGVRKYGFHGTSYSFVLSRMKDILQKDKPNLIICHLGNGASIAAIKDGKCLDTSMGMTPLAGVMMGTRSGDFDPAIIEYISSKTGKNLEEIMVDLNKKSGFLGVSGVSADARDIEDAIKIGNERAMLSYQIYYKKIVDYIASYYVQLGHVDAICFTAGLGEKGLEAREEICKKLEVLGVKIDLEKNNSRGKEVLISGTDSKIQVFVVPTNEELVIARDTLKLIS